MSAPATDPLNQPITLTVPEGRPPWRDNAYVCFWDPERDILGVLHVSTSANGEGRRARFSLGASGRSIEIVETPHSRAAWKSDSIDYPLSDTIQVDHPRLQAELTLKPRFQYADYSTSQVIPPLVPDEPQQHFQQVVDVAGRISFDGEEIDFHGDGFRDRSWGYRDESAHIVEYLSFMAVFDDFGFTALRFLDVEGGNRTEGFLLNDEGIGRITAVGATRDGSGLLEAAHLEIDGKPFESEVTAKKGGFWVPMGPSRRGPTLSAYDELVELRTADGKTGHAFVEHAGIRRIF
jgi:hypothetical protein